jgi:hypothetical protein
MAESFTICDCYASEQTMRGIHLSDTPVSTAGRVPIVIRWSTGREDIMTPNNGIVCCLQEGDLKGIIEGNLYKLS